MSHELEQSDDGRTAVMVAGGEPAWHSLGEFKEAPATLEEAMTGAHLNNWDVRKVPIYGQRDDKGGMAGRTIALPDQYMTVRNNPWTGEPEGLGVVGKLWTPFQNEELVEAAQAVLDEGGANVHTAGSINNGRNVFVSLKLPESIMVGGDDAVDCYIVATTAHDGSASNQFRVTPVRPVCKNTLLAGARAARSYWSFRHTSGMEGKVQEAREGLKLTWKYMEHLKTVFDGMIASPFSDTEMEGFLKELIPDPKSDAQGWVDRAEGQRLGVMNLFKYADTCESGRGTKWAAWNAVTEYADWHRPGNPERRAKEALGVGVNVALKPQAFKLLTTSGRKR